MTETSNQANDRRAEDAQAADGIKGVVFDFGGVMTSCTMPERVRPLVKELGVAWQDLEEGFRKYRRLMDADLMPFDEMYRKIWADAGVTIDEATQAKILEEDMASFLYRNERMLAWMRQLKAKGFKIGILTNMCTLLAVHFRESFGDFIALADAMVISGEVHLYKPQKEIYDLLRERIGLKAEELLFVDDVESNCAGARAAGWKALRFISNEQVECDFLHGLWR